MMFTLEQALKTQQALREAAGTLAFSCTGERLWT